MVRGGDYTMDGYTPWVHAMGTHANEYIKCMAQRTLCTGHDESMLTACSGHLLPCFPCQIVLLFC